MDVWACPGAAQLVPALRDGAGAVVVAKEYLDDRTLRELIAFLCEQPHWSDLPLVLLTWQGAETDHAWQAVSSLDNAANLILLERPLPPYSLQSTVRGLLRSRRWQYRVRQHINELEDRDRTILEARERLQFTLEAANVGTWEWELDTGSLQWSPNLPAIIGESDAALENAPDLLFRTSEPADAQRVQRAIQAVIDSVGDPAPLHVQFRRQTDRGLRWIEARGHAMPDNRQRSRRLAGIVADVTERKHAEANDLMAALARTDKLTVIGQMTASILHEVGNPLAAMKTRLQAAQLAPLDRTDYATVVEESLQDISRLAAFLHSFRRLARDRHPTRESLGAWRLLEDVVTMLAPGMRRRRLDVGLDPGRDPDHGPDQPVFIGDADLVRHVLVNLVLNSADASQPGGTVRLAVDRSQRGMVGLRVIDQGEGIPPHHLARIWEPFFSTRTESSGMGLGLGICQRIVHALTGTIDVRSTPGSGSVFTVYLPECRNLDRGGSHAADH